MRSARWVSYVESDCRMVGHARGWPLTPPFSPGYRGEGVFGARLRLGVGFVVGPTLLARSMASGYATCPRSCFR